MNRNRLQQSPNPLRSLLQRPLLRNLHQRPLLRNLHLPQHPDNRLPLRRP